MGKNIGKNKCDYLKKIRENIAKHYGIPFQTKECGFEGECKGTCPKCEQEVRYLEMELLKMGVLKKSLTLACALPMMASAVGSAEAPLKGMMAPAVEATDFAPLEKKVVRQNFSPASLQHQGEEGEIPLPPPPIFDPLPPMLDDHIDGDIEVDIPPPPKPDDIVIGDIDYHKDEIIPKCPVVTIDKSKVQIEIIEDSDETVD
ncbi:MAG: hypothetical protein U0L74_04495 [Paludibacteraceae bacterium]|nr:hypothetical protein [Paludibacteraceae bacterium]